jgi:hypothetical protein
MDRPRLDDVLGDDAHGLIVHHWDADGISTAAMLQMYLERRGKTIELFSPVIGNFFLSESDRRAIMGNYDFVIVCDIALPAPDIGWVAERWKTIHIDHHLLKHDDLIQINPVVNGADPSAYPSASWVTTEFLGMPHSLLSIYGVIGDVGKRVVEMPVWEDVKKVMDRYHLEFDDVQEIVDLLDSSYKVGDLDGVVNAVEKLRNAYEDPEAILHDKAWHENLGSIDTEMERLLSLPTEVVHGITVIEIETRYNLISALGRAISADLGAAFVINRGYFEDRDQLYLRRADGITVGDIIDAARGNGYSAGGKNEVVGMVVPKDETENAIGLVYELSAGKVSQ